jgi:hypothetical protein
MGRLNVPTTYCVDSHKLELLLPKVTRWGSRVLRRRQSFHRIGIGIAADIALIGAAIVRLDLLQSLRGNDFAIALGCAFIALGVLSIAVYGLVRAIEWVSRR